MNHIATDYMKIYVAAFRTRGATTGSHFPWLIQALDKILFHLELNVLPEITCDLLSFKTSISSVFGKL